MVLVCSPPRRIGFPLSAQSTRRKSRRRESGEESAVILCIVHHLLSAVRRCRRSAALARRPEDSPPCSDFRIPLPRLRFGFRCGRTFSGLLHSAFCTLHFPFRWCAHRPVRTAAGTPGVGFRCAPARSRTNRVLWCWPEWVRWSDLAARTMRECEMAGSPSNFKRVLDTPYLVLGTANSVLGTPYLVLGTPYSVLRTQYSNVKPGTVVAVSHATKPCRRDIPTTASRPGMDPTQPMFIQRLTTSLHPCSINHGDIVLGAFSCLDSNVRPCDTQTQSLVAMGKSADHALGCVASRRDSVGDFQRDTTSSTPTRVNCEVRPASYSPTLPHARPWAKNNQQPATSKP